MEFVLLLSLGLLGLLVWINHTRYRDPLYPPVIHASLWLFILTAFALTRDQFIPVSETTFAIFLTGALTFSVGSWMATIGYRPPVKRRIAPAVQRDIFTEILFWIPIVLLPVALNRLRELGSEGFSNSILVNARYNMSKDAAAADAMGATAYIAPIAMANAAYELYQWNAPSDRAQPRAPWRLAASVLVAGLFAVMSTGRTLFFLLGSVALGITLLHRKMSAARAVLTFAGLGLVAFGFMAIVMQKGGSVDEGIEQNAVGVAEMFRVYLLGSIPAFDIHLKEYAGQMGGSHVFRTFYAILASLRFISPADVPPLIQEYVAIPQPYNVYTVYQPYYDDFSWWGLFAVQLLLGLWHGFLYRKAQEGVPIFIFLFSLFLYPLLMQFFQDQYMSLLSMWVQFSIYGWLLFARGSRQVAGRAKTPPVEVECLPSTSSS